MAPDASDPLEIEIQPRMIPRRRRLGHERAPRIDDHRSPVGRLTGGPPICEGARDVGGVIDRARPAGAPPNGRRPVRSVRRRDRQDSASRRRPTRRYSSGKRM